MRGNPSVACIPYFVLLQWEPGEGVTTGRWAIEFGSYDRSDCSAERSDLHYGYEDIPLKHLRIKRICSCEADREGLQELASNEPAP
jgi:hypothetical protein